MTPQATTRLFSRRNPQRGLRASCGRFSRRAPCRRPCTRSRSQSGCRRVSRIWIGACVAVNSISLLLCDSNGALVLLIGYAFFFVLYKMSDPVNETYFQYFLYAGFAAIGLSLIRFVMRFMY